jgi:hypothetical protein
MHTFVPSCGGVAQAAGWSWMLQVGHHHHSISSKDIEITTSVIGNDHPKKRLCLFPGLVL